MLSAFINAILPVFSVVIIGYGLGRRGIFDGEAVHTINKLVFYALLPPFFIGLTGQAPFAEFKSVYLLAYFAVSLAINFSVVIAAYKLFGRSFHESILLGFMAGFVNHTFFILPVARVIFGADAVLPVTAVIALDMMFMYGATVVAMDCTRTAAADRSLRGTLLHVGKTVLKNPHSQALSAGVLLNIAGVSFDNGLGVFTSFLGSAAAPCSLFSLGLFLAQQPLCPSRENVGIVTYVSAVKLLLMPVLAFVSLSLVFQLPGNWAGPGLFVAAGPCGSLPFILATQYKVRVDAISQILLFTTFASVFTLTASLMLQ